QKYMSKVSGPFLDRIDLHVEIPVLRIEELFSEGALPEPSRVVRDRVEKARSRQRQRYAQYPPGRRVNARLFGKELQQHCALNSESKALLKNTVERLALSARAFDRFRKVARTSAALDQSNDIQAGHIA